MGIALRGGALALARAGFVTARELLFLRRGLVARPRSRKCSSAPTKRRGRCRSAARGCSAGQKISRKQEWPDWRPPPEMIERQPYLPRFMAGGPGNPLGARAMYLGQTVYRVHGTNQPQTIGSRVVIAQVRDDPLKTVATSGIDKGPNAIL